MAVSTMAENSPSETKGCQHWLSIENEKDFVTIESDTIINNVRVVIKDEKGDIMFDGNVTIESASRAIYVPEEYDNEKYTIEVFLGKERFLGTLKGKTLLQTNMYIKL